MSDESTRDLERMALTGGFQQEDLERLKAAWARSLTYRACEECKAHVPELAWERHQYEHSYHADVEAQRIELMREITPGYPAAPVVTLGSGSVRERPGIPVVAIPSPGIVASRPSKTPLWHYVKLQPGTTRFRFFYDQEGELGPAWLAETRGHLPERSFFYLYGLSILPDADAPRTDLLRIYTSGMARLVWGHTYLNESPARLMGATTRPLHADEVMAEPGAEALESMAPLRSVTISGRPLPMQALQGFSWDLAWKDPIKEPVGLMALFHGISLRGISG